MKRLLTALLIALAVTASPAMAKKPKMTPMELQAIQSREFEVDKATAFAAVMTVIQDLGYTVESADLGSGFITAGSPNENKTNFWGALAGETASGNTVMTAFLMQMPNTLTRVRLNFVNSKNLSSAYGRTSRQDKPILDPAVYNNAWERIDEALFVMGALTDEAPAPTDASEPTSTEPQEPSATSVSNDNADPDVSDVDEGEPEAATGQ